MKAGIKVKMMKGRTMIGSLIPKTMNANEIIYIRLLVFYLDAIYERHCKSLMHYDPVEDIRSQGTYAFVGMHNSRLGCKHQSLAIRCCDIVSKISQIYGS